MSNYIFLLASYLLAEWSEIAQGIGALIAIPASMIAVYKLIKRDKQRDQEVESFVKMAKHYEELVSEERNSRRNKNLPRLHISELSYKNETLYLTATNVGATAFNVQFHQGLLIDKWLSSESISVITSGLSSNFILIKPRKPSTPIVAVFRDIEGTLYTQLFTWRDNEMKFESNAPEINPKFQISKEFNDEIQKWKVNSN